MDADFLLPKTGKIILIFASIFGGLFSFLYGDVKIFMIWLLLLMACDFITGWTAAFVTGTWSSNKNFLGIFKKIFALMIVALAHGLDVIFSEYLGISIIQAVVICAYAAGEFGSIIENLERGGFGSCVPIVLRKMIENVNNTIEEKADKILKK